MKIIVHGPAAGIIWNGTMKSWGVDEPVDIPDDDPAAVAWARTGAAGGLVTITEDAPAEKPRRSTVPRS